ncbi:MAG: shikimate kinase [Candidatus Electrothrix sp. AX2]|nr:shikimate kinase [Candidatus Electrothrix gigas]
MREKSSNIILIGMPGAGKSTVGVLLASKISRNFLDTDLVIQESQGRALQDIVNTEGQAGLRILEEEVLLNLSLQNHVIATGGSAVYSEQGMTYLASDGITLFLDADQATLEARIHNLSMRGLVRQPGQTFSQLFNERLPLYRKYADIIINSTGQTQEAVCAKSIAELRKNNVI